MDNPPSPNCTAVYDDAERGHAGGTDIMEEGLPLGNQMYYGPIPVYQMPFGEQLGGGGQAQSWNFRQHVPLTLLGSGTQQSQNFARRRAEARASPSPDTASLQPPASQDSSTLEDFLKGLDDDAINTLAHDYSSNFSLSPTVEDCMPIEDDSAAIGAEDNMGTNNNGVAPADHDHVPVSQNLASPKARSLLEDFYSAGEFEKIVVPPKPQGHAQSANETDVNPSDPFIIDSNVDSPAPSTPTPQRQLQSTTDIPPAMGESPSKGRLSNSSLEHCQEIFARIEENFIDLARLVQRPIMQVKKRYFSGMRVSRNTSDWNLYQAYFKKYRDSELERCGLLDGTDADCWPSFQILYGDNTEAFLQSCLDLDRVSGTQETLQQRLRTFRKHCLKLEKLNKEGVENRFQTFTIIVGDCLQEDQSLSAILTTPGLADFIANRLKVKEDTVLGLAKCEVYNVVAEKITKTQFDAEKLVNELNEAFDIIEAELKPPPSVPTVSTRGDEDDIVMDDDSNVISNCKKHLIQLLKVATEDAGQRWSGDRLPWATLPNHLTTISHVITGWPPSCAMPNETNKRGKGKQGIKDLGSKDGRVLLTALQNGELKLSKVDRDQIKRDKTAVITTADPTSEDAPEVWTRALYASGRVSYGSWAPKSAAATRVKKRKKHSNSANIKSDDDEFNMDEFKPPAPSSTKDKPSPPKSVVTISSDSDSDSLMAKGESKPLSPPALKKRPSHPKPISSPPASKKPPSQPKHVIAVSSEINVDASVVKNKPVSSSEQFLPKKPKKRVTIVSADSEDEQVTSDSNKRPRLSPPDASEDPVGSGDDYEEGQDNDDSEKEVVVTPRSRSRIKHAVKGKSKEEKKYDMRTTQANSSKTVDPPNMKQSFPRHTGPVAPTPALKTTNPSSTAPRPMKLKAKLTATTASKAPTPATDHSHSGSHSHSDDHSPSANHSQVGSALLHASAKPVAAAAVPATAPAINPQAWTMRNAALRAPVNSDPLPHPDNSFRVPPHKQKMSSTTAPQAAHQLKTGQDIVDSFPPSLLKHSPGPRSAPAEPTLRQSSQPPRNDENLQSNRTATPFIPEPSHFDSPTEEDPYFAQGFEDDYPYDVDMYSNAGYPDGLAYGNFNMSTGPNGPRGPAPAYRARPLRYPNVPPRGQARYMTHPYPRQGYGRPMQYPPPRARSHYGSQHGHGAPNAAGPSSHPPGPSRSQAFPSMHGSGEQFWNSMSQYGQEECHSVDSNTPS